MLVSGSSSDRHQPAINEYFNRTLMVVGESVFDQTQSMIEQFTITVESKKSKKELEFSKPQWSVALETVLDHCRMVHDILPEEAGVCVALQHHSSEILMTNDWTWEQQNFLQISKRLSSELDKLYGTAIEIEQREPTTTIPSQQQLEQLCQNMFLQLFSQGEAKAREKSQTNINYSFRVIYMAKCSVYFEEYSEVQSNIVIPLASIFEKQFEKFKTEVRTFLRQSLEPSASTFNQLEFQSKSQLFKIFSSFSDEELAKMKCSLDIIFPLLHPVFSQVYPNDSDISYICSAYDPTSGGYRKPNLFENVKIWEIERDCVDKVIRENIAQKQYGLVLISVQGIPMRDVSEGTANYDVLLACKGLTYDLTQDVNISSGVIDLKWVRADPKRSIEHLYTTKSVHRITPVLPYTLPTQCLMKHLSTKKPVALLFESSYNLAHNHAPTHLILQHGQDVYLHVLHLNRVFQPYISIVQSEDTNCKYRINEFVDIVNSHLLRVNVKKDTEPVSEKTSEANPNYSLMKHNNFIYTVPTGVERFTRFFPLTSDETSVLFFENAKETYPTMFQKILSPLLNIIYKKAPESLSERDKVEIERLFSTLYQNCKNNEEQTLPELRNDHTKRWNTYRKVWSELRMLVVTMNYKEYGLSIMDRLWPQFFFDKSGNETPDTTSRRTKKVVEVQRDRYGNIVFPIPLGALTVHALGKVVYDRSTFHTDKYIWPVGYKSTRYYTSVKDTNRRCLYTCEIKDGGEAPIFVLTSDDSPNEIIEAPSATAAWTAIVKQINKIKSEESGKRVFTNVSGPEYFGLAHPTIMKLISQLPNAEKVNRPNAPHQPVKTSEAGSSNDMAESDDEDFESTPMVQPTTPTTPNNQTPASSFDTSDLTQPAPDIIKKRMKRNEMVYYERDIVRNEIQKVHWSPDTNLTQFMEQKYQKLVGKPLDGEQDGEKGLYAHLNLNQSDKSSNQQSGSANHNHQGNQNYGQNPRGQRKFGHKRKFALYQ